jgi:hypothetical protein
MYGRTLRPAQFRNKHAVHNLPNGSEIVRSRKALRLRKIAACSAEWKMAPRHERMKSMAFPV